MKQLPGDTRADRYREAMRLLRGVHTKAQADEIIEAAAISPVQREQIYADWIAFLEATDPTSKR